MTMQRDIATKSHGAMSQQRDDFRVEVARPVLVYPQGAPIPISTYTVDLSGGGFLLAGPSTLYEGERIRFKLRLRAEEEPVVGAGTVMRRDAKGRCSIAFEPLSGPDERRVVRFVFEVQRLQRRVEVEVEREHGRRG